MLKNGMLNSTDSTVTKVLIGPTKVICETGAGAHLIATAACCAKFSLPCIGYMGIEDVAKQSTNVLKAKLFGSKVVECVDGTGKKGVLKDACTAALKAWEDSKQAGYRQFFESLQLG